MSTSVKLLQPDVPPPETWLPLLAESYRQHWYSNFGPNARLLCEEAAAFLGTDRAVSLVCSATAGLTATLLALGVRGKVALPAFTFPATASAVFQAGCQPVAVDADPDTWEMAPAALEAALARGEIGAIIHVRSFGYCRDVSWVDDIARRHGIPLIIDAAAAFGGTDPGGRLVGRSGVAEVFSLHATKPFAVGEGGLITAAPELIAEIDRVINFSLAGGMAAEVWGMNAKMSEVSAAIGRAALRNLPEVTGYRAALAEGYRTRLADVAGVQLPEGIGQPPWQLYSLKLAPGAATTARDQLEARGIQSRIYYNPTVSSRWPGQSAPVAEALTRQMLALPMGRHVTPDVQARVCEALADIHDAYRAAAE